MMRINILTIFPELFPAFLSFGMMKKAREKGLLTVKIHDLRDYTTDRHRSVDDVPFGGGAGMVMKVEPIHSAITDITSREGAQKRILLSPQGRVLNARLAKLLASETSLLMICGRYEGVDERVREHLVDEEISIGDYVLTGGEIPSMVVMEAMVRFIPGVLGSSDSLNEESFNQEFLEYPQYTRPAKYLDWEVPSVLLSGNHENIKQWRIKSSLFKTAKNRPDLIEWNNLSSGDIEWLKQCGVEIPDFFSDANKEGTIG
ncbi:MAG: tRNA (guanosine(37)-N1)-methyltransferase TrmD [bacterium]